MTTPTTMPAIQHVAITVSDLEASEAWYNRVFGVKPVLSEDTGPFRHAVYELGGTLFGLHGFPELTTVEPFDERRPGLALRAHHGREHQGRAAGGRDSPDLLAIGAAFGILWSCRLAERRQGKQAGKDRGE